MIYSYEAKDGGGRTITGSLEAPDERTAARQVRDLGYFLMRLAPPVGVPLARDGGGASAAPSRAEPEAVTPGVLPRLLHSLWSGVGLKDLALFYRQFATMIRAGVPLYQSLTTLSAQTGSPALRRCIAAIGRHVQAGGSLSGAMGQFPWVFQDFHRAMIRAGEETGRLDLMFARLADALEQEYTLRGAIRKETFYPVSVFFVSFPLNPQAIVALVVGGNPRLFFVLAGAPLLGFLGAALGAVVLFRLVSQAKAVFDAVLSNTPGVGGAVRMIALARFARSLSLLYAAGLSMPQALRASAAACGNAYLAGKMVRAVPLLEGGEGIAQSLGRTGALPAMVVTMLGVGEQTGDLDGSMTKVAEYFEQEAAVRLHQLCVTLGVVVTVLVGINVGLGVIHYYQGYFSSIMNDAG